MNQFILLRQTNTLHSCGPYGKFKQLEEIENDLKDTFNHSYISILEGFGTDPEDSRLAITFYKFNSDDMTNADLQKLANQVSTRVLQKQPRLSHLNFIEVIFTADSDPEKIINSTSFKMPVR